MKKVGFISVSRVLRFHQQSHDIPLDNSLTSTDRQKDKQIISLSMKPIGPPSLHPPAASDDYDIDIPTACFIVTANWGQSLLDHHV